MTKQFCFFPPWPLDVFQALTVKLSFTFEMLFTFLWALSNICSTTSQYSVLGDLYLVPLQPPQGRIYMHIKFWNGSFHEEIISDRWLGFCHLFPVRKLKQRSKSSGDGSVKCSQICFRIGFGQAVMQNVLFLQMEYPRGFLGGFVECYELPLKCKHELISRNWVWARLVSWCPLNGPWVSVSGTLQ